MNKKRFKVSAFTPLFLLSLTIALQTQPNGGEFQKFDETAYFNDDDYNIYDENFSNYILRSNHTNAKEIIDFLMGQDLHIQDVLQKNLYRYTNPANIRPLLDLPAYQNAYPYSIPCDKSAGIIPFYTQTREQYMSAHSPYLCSYLAFSEFNDLDRILKSQQLNLGPSFDLPQILALFNPIKLEDRRAGAIFAIGKSHGCGLFGLEFPFYYIERNMFINKEEQQAIAQNPFFQELSGSGCSSSPSVEAFIKQHVVGDLLGFGDTRLSAFWRRESLDAYLSGGLELTLPTAAIVMDHLIAHHRCRSPMQPSVDVLSLIDLNDDADSNTFQDTITNLSVCALDRFLRICTDTKLGSETVTIAPRADLFHPLGRNTSLAHMARFTCFLPHRTVRFFRECKTAEDFDLVQSPETAHSDLHYLTTRLINMIYPQAQEVKVATRFSFEYSLALQAVLRKATVELGYDLWLMSQEELSFTSRPRNDVPLDLRGAESPSAIQQKIFGRVMWEHEGRCGRLWHLGIVGDWTASSYGIGHDWSLGFTANILW